MILKLSRPGAKLKYFKKLLKDFENACEHKLMKGSYPPEEFQWCDDNYKKIRESIINYVKDNNF